MFIIRHDNPARMERFIGPFDTEQHAQMYGRRMEQTHAWVAYEWEIKRLDQPVTA